MGVPSSNLYILFLPVFTILYLRLASYLKKIIINDASIRYKVIEFVNSPNVDVYKYNFDENKLVIHCLSDHDTEIPYDNLSTNNKKEYLSYKILRRYEDYWHFYCIIYFFNQNPFGIAVQNWYIYYINGLV